MASVNETSSPAAPRESLDYIGTALPRIIHAIAAAETNIPCLFTKADIKDGFWRNFVEKAGRWNFAYVLPNKGKNDKISIVVPNSILMGWVESMYVFCSGSETARDVVQKLLQELNLPKHYLENYMIPRNTSLPEATNEQNKPVPETLLQFIKDYVDNFIGICQATSIQDLRHVSCSLLHGIESIFPNGISVNKLIKEG